MMGFTYPSLLIFNSRRIIIQGVLSFSICSAGVIRQTGRCEFITSGIIGCDYTPDSVNAISFPLLKYIVTVECKIWHADERDKIIIWFNEKVLLIQIAIRQKTELA